MKKALWIGITVCLLLSTGCSAPASDQPMPTASPTVPSLFEAPSVEPTLSAYIPDPIDPNYANLPYMQDFETAHRLDVYLPPEVFDVLPTILMIPDTLDSKDDLFEVGDYFSDLGFAFVIVEYETQVDPQTSIRNLLCSVAWVHAKAEQYSFDTERIYLMGYSMGGLFAATMASLDDVSHYQEGCPHTIPTDNRIRGVITVAGLFATPDVCLAPDGDWCMSAFESAYSIPLTQMEETFDALRGVPFQGWKNITDLSDDARSFAQDLPLYWIDGTEPPFLLFHGDADELVPMSESQAFASAVRAAAGEAEVYALPGATHSLLDPSTYDFLLIVELTLEFMMTH